MRREIWEILPSRPGEAKGALRETPPRFRIRSVGPPGMKGGPNILCMVIRPQCFPKPPGYGTYERNPEGTGKPAWLSSKVYGPITEYLDSVGKRAEAPVGEDDVHSTIEYWRVMDHVWFYFDNLVHDCMQCVEEAPGDLDSDLLASILGLTRDQVRRDIERDLLPTVAGTRKRIIDRKALLGQMFDEIAE